MSENAADDPLPPGISKVMAQRCGPEGWRDTEVTIFHMQDGSSRELTEEEMGAAGPPAWWGDTLKALQDGGDS